MAVTKMHPIRRTIGKAVDYITDKDKTDGEIYVSTYGCTRETVEDDFDYTRHKASYNGSILAQHIIQSFAEGEVTPEQAHKIGIALAGRFTDHKHEYIIATHTLQAKTGKSTTVSLDKEIKQAAEILRYARQYSETHKYEKAYNKCNLTTETYNLQV